MMTIAKTSFENQKHRLLRGGIPLRVRHSLTGWLTTVFASVAIFVIGSGRAVGQTGASFTTAGNATWTCPTGVTFVQVEAWGGGGGSGGAGAHYASTGGGAGGSYVKVTSFAVTPGTVYQLTVGAGGTAGVGGAANSGTAGGMGGASYFGNTTAGNPSGAAVLAVGGAGSVGNNTAGSATTTRTVTAGASASNSGNVPSSGAAVNRAGTSGATPVTNANNSGAGGAGAGPNGSAGGGAGGAGLTSAGPANPGTAPGGGGGGADQSSSPSNGAGASGGAGKIVLSYSYTVTYDGNGNTGGSIPNDSSSPYLSGSTVTILGNSGGLAKSGFYFSGWNTSADGSGTAYSAGGTFTISANTKLYAQYSASLAVIYLGNGNTGGTAPIDPSSPYTPGTLVTVLGGGSLTKPGYTFAGWNTAANGSGTSFSPGGSFNISTATTLYAQYLLTPTVTYDANGATGGTVPVDGNSPYSYGASVIVLGNSGSLTKTGYTFAGWNTTTNGSGSSYSPGSSFNITANTTLFALWTINSYTVTYNGNGNTGGTVPVDSANHNYNTSVTVLGNTSGLVNGSLTFVGWNTAADGSGTTYTAGSGSFPITENTTLYAKWIHLITGWTFENNAIAVNNSPAPSTGMGTASSLGMDAYPSPNIGVTTDDVVAGVAGDTGANGVANLTEIWRIRGQAGTNGAANGWSSAAPIGAQGVQFAVSTLGYNAINVTFDWYTTAQGEGKLQLQYTTDGSTWNNLAIRLGGTTSAIAVTNNTTSSATVTGYFVQSGASDWYTGLTATITDSAANNNTNFAIRIVNASTGTDCVNASGAALNNSSGNWRFDNVFISGTPLPLPDLAIALAGPASANAGANYDYTLSVANSGFANATGVTAQFTLPAGLTFVSASDNGSGGFMVPTSAPGGLVNFTGGSLNAGASDTLTVTVNAANGGNYTAAVGSAVIDPNNTVTEFNENNNSNATSVVTSVSIADLTVDVTAGAATALAGNNFTYTLTAQNIGSSTASGVEVDFTLPSGINFVSATDNGSGAFTVPTSATSGVVALTGGTLVAGGSETFTITVAASTGGTFTLPAGAAAINPSHTVLEGNYGNNASVSTFSTVVTAPDLSITGSHNGNFQPGDLAASYTVYVRNVGSTGTSGGAVTVSQTLPAGITPAASLNGTTINGWSVAVSGQTATATRSDVLPIDSNYPALTITVSIDPTASGVLSSTAIVSGGGDVSPGNDTITVTVDVGPATPIVIQNNLIVSRSVYTGTASTVSYPGKLSNGADSVHDGTYPGVWGNEGPDAAFGITSPIYLDQMTKGGSIVNSVSLTDAVKSQVGLDVSTSFPSKSELALNLTPDGSGLTFMCYLAATNSQDVSNTDTPYHVDTSNPVTGIGTRARAVVQLDSYGNVQVTPSYAYSGNNGRAAVLAGGNYFTVGNAGNGSPDGAGLTLLSDDTGLQMLTPGAGGNSTPVGYTYGTAGSATGYQHGFSVATVGFAPGKTGKDMNLRGLTYNPYNDTLYVSKGSGGNGINTVYQVGPGGVPTVADANSLVFTILPGFSQTSAKTGQDSSGNAQTVYYPFGMWFANATTLYVADEGQVSTSPTLVYDSVNQVYSNALPANNPTAGLQKWTFDGTKWNLIYTLQAGLKLGVPYSVPNDTTGNVYPTGINPATGLPWTPSNNGLRNITGQVNGDGTVTIFGITSTASGATDQGGDPNQLVSITDSLAATSPASGEAFTTLRIAAYGEVLRGVALAPGASATIATSASPAGGGTTSGGGATAIGTPVTLTATANAGYTFVNWTESGTPVSTSASFGFTATQDRVLVANFASGNADLSSWLPDNGTLAPGFDPSLLNYTDSVDYSVSSLTIIPTVADNTATVTVNGTAVTSGSASTAIALNVGLNTITTIVTAQDGTTKTYTLVVTRAADANANLASLVPSAGTLSPAFAVNRKTYSDSVDYTTSTLTVTPTVTDPTATVTVNGTPVTSGTASAPIALNSGENIITTVVTAQNGTTTRTYVLTVTQNSQPDTQNLPGQAEAEVPLLGPTGIGIMGLLLAATGAFVRRKSKVA